MAEWDTTSTFVIKVRIVKDIAIEVKVYRKGKLLKNETLKIHSYYLKP